MLFNSYIFILFFLPITLIFYFLFNHLGKDRIAKAYLLGMSLWFYGYFNPSYLAIICVSICVNYCFSKKMAKAKANLRKCLLVLGIVFNVGLIFYFKYYDFFISNINTAFGTDFVLKNIMLPLGISFFTFQQISFIVDSYKGETKDYSFLEYALFVAFFPQLVAGPIVLHSELIPQFKDKNRLKPDYDNLSKGLMMFTRGLSKKILIADTFGNAVDYGFSRAALYVTGENALSPREIMIVMLAYTFQIYFDFSGYSDMATGIGAMFNLKIPMNFNSPYKALSVADFWKRWHMTLTRFLTTYIYIPLGGNRKGKLRTYINIMIVFLVSGLWHGANWTFILWGIIHGLGQCFNKLTHSIYLRIYNGLERMRLGKAWTTILKVVQWGVTFIFINVTWLLFRADSVKQFTDLLKRLFVPYYYVGTEVLEYFRIPKIRYVFNLIGVEMTDMQTLVFSTFVIMAAALGLVLWAPNNYECKYKKNVSNLIVTALLLVICIVSMGKVSAFLYFNF
ncbi:MBOAT family O-acyltransferase [Butyrivibrio sp. YAB3001]|uniref:MBOAT family O-acyltransferase n=1 Tax=Butyrivibrio sp. YAB3001 TaxID=1520812 RepID=UPI0008F6876C|nr:MBOAT family O-acyltransferase [Butyrivibrio sp. YAB3001]SFC76749.1 D-alanyl-lipoteichoic acid acyltransferase DltB, MBOAT superfamily [Butyrivibrio sp. YAB3001]